MANYGVLFSGGKDSCLALLKALEKKMNVRVLLSILPEEMDSMMVHTPSEILLKKQAEMLGIPLIIKQTKAKDEKEELEALKDLLKQGKKKYKFDTIVIGGIASSYQAKRITTLANELELGVFAPLWNFSPEQIWNELLNKNFKVVITKISCEGLGKEWLGKIIDKNNLEQLKKLAEKYKFRLDFEGGEAETAVLFMPKMKKEIKISFDITSEGEYRHFLNVNEAK